MAINTGRQAACIAKISGSLGKVHPYFAEGGSRLEEFINDSHRLIEDAGSQRARTGKGLSERGAEVLRRALAGETYEQIGETGSANGLKVTGNAIRQVHVRALGWLRSYVRKHSPEFDERLMDRISAMMTGEGNRNATPYERFLYTWGRELEQRVAGLEAELDAAVREKLYGEGLTQSQTTPLTGIKEFGVPKGYVNKLGRLGLQYVEELRGYTREGLMGKTITYLDGTKHANQIGKVGIRFIETALGYLGYGFKGEEPKPFPTGEALRQSQTGLIFHRKVEENMAKGGIETMQQFAVAPMEKVRGLLGPDSYTDVLKISHYYERALQEIREHQPTP